MNFREYIAKSNVQHPGSRGGHGYYNAQGEWVYGERPVLEEDTVGRGTYYVVNGRRYSETERAKALRSLRAKLGHRGDSIEMDGRVQKVYFTDTETERLQDQIASLMVALPHEDTVEKRAKGLTDQSPEQG